MSPRAFLCLAAQRARVVVYLVHKCGNVLGRRALQHTVPKVEDVRAARLRAAKGIKHAARFGAYGLGRGEQ